tara:strand:+ start:3139 stop:4935 length:1797 start_codon:yes stop_codon:yes gene_type:complete
MITWQQFINLPVNKKLSLREQKSKFLLENTKLLTDLEAIEAMYGAAGAAGGFSGVASDGPIAGATVTSPGAGTAVTDTNGRFTLPGIPTGEITVTGGTDSITGVPFTGELKGFPEYEVISPMTTLAYHLKEEDNNLDADGAIDLLFASSSTLFGIELAPEDKDVMLKKDYVAESVLGNNQKAVAAQSIATYLESVTEIVGSSIATAAEEYQAGTAKVEAYKTIARQIRDTSGAKAAINPETLFDNVTFTGEEVEFEPLHKNIIASEINNVRTELESLARSETFSTNYLTTRIQAINRGVKKEYIEEAEKVFRGQKSEFKGMDDLVGASTGSLTQIEDGKANEVDKDTSRKSDAQFYDLTVMTYTQETKGEGTVTLANPSGKGAKSLNLDRNAFVSYTSNVALEDGMNLPDNILESLKGGYLLDMNKDPFDFVGATNYDKAAPIIATQSSPTEQNEETGKVYQITIANPSFRITKAELIDQPSGKHLPTGKYTLESAIAGEEELLWNPPKAAPDFGTVGANQTTVSATVKGKLGDLTYTVEYNTDRSRYQILLNNGETTDIIGYISGDGSLNQGFDVATGWNTDASGKIVTKYRIKVKA